MQQQTSTMCNSLFVFKALRFFRFTAAHRKSQRTERWIQTSGSVFSQGFTGYMKTTENQQTDSLSQKHYWTKYWTKYFNICGGNEETTEKEKKKLQRK